MSDNSELKRLVDRVLADRRFCGDENHKALADGVLALIAENERLSADCSSMRGSLKANAVSIKKLIKDGGRAARERDQLKAENNRLQSAANTLARIGYTDHGGELWTPPIGQKPNFDQIDQLRAEIAGLKTGYEAYERVNAELKAEVEGLRREREGKVLCDLELFETLRDSANTEADEHRQCMATYRPLRQASLDSVVKKCDDLLADLGQGEQS